MALRIVVIGRRDGSTLVGTVERAWNMALRTVVVRRRGSKKTLLSQLILDSFIDGPGNCSAGHARNLEKAEAAELFEKLVRPLEPTLDDCNALIVYLKLGDLVGNRVVTATITLHLVDEVLDNIDRRLFASLHGCLVEGVDYAAIPVVHVDVQSLCLGKSATGKEVLCVSVHVVTRG
ncbi:hypothetical protein BC567DRAFT_235905 [Phyllosticta citribraziliensis]